MWTKKFLTHKSMNLPFNSKVTGKRKKKTIIKLQEEINTLQNRRIGINQSRVEKLGN